MLRSLEQLTAEGHLVPIGRDEVHATSSLVLAPVRLARYASERHWLGWCSETGRLLQTFRTPGEIVVVHGDEQEPIVVTGGTYSDALEA